VKWPIELQVESRRTYLDDIALAIRIVVKDESRDLLPVSVSELLEEKRVPRAAIPFALLPLYTQFVFLVSFLPAEDI